LILKNQVALTDVASSDKESSAPQLYRAAIGILKTDEPSKKSTRLNPSSSWAASTMRTTILSLLVARSRLIATLLRLANWLRLSGRLRLARRLRLASGWFRLLTLNHLLRLLLHRRWSGLTISSLVPLLSGALLRRLLRLWSWALLARFRRLEALLVTRWSHLGTDRLRVLRLLSRCCLTRRSILLLWRTWLLSTWWRRRFSGRRRRFSRRRRGGYRRFILKG